MTSEKIYKGFEFRTENGYAVCDSYNGHIVFCEEYVTDWETGEETGEVNNLMLTTLEIARYLRDMDNRNHYVTWHEKKLYEDMKENENLDWCRPYIDEDGDGVSINYDALYSSNEIHKRYAITYSVGLNATKEEVMEMIRDGRLKETGCCNCPFRDECDAMDI